MNLSERLGAITKSERVQRNWSLDDVANTLTEWGIDVSRPTLGRIENGAQASFPIVDGLCKLFGWSLSELEKKLSKDVVHEDAAAYNSGLIKPKRKIAPTLGRYIPLLKWDCTEEPCEKFFTDKMPQNTFALKVSGKSMESSSTPSFPDESFILVNPDKKCVHGDYVVIKDKSTNKLIFRQLIIDQCKKMLTPVNPQFPIVELTNEMSVIGVVYRQVIDKRI